MAKISIVLPDELVNYLDQKVENKSIFIASILQQWRQQEAEELAQAFLAVDELELGWTDEWQTAAIINSGLFSTLCDNFCLYGIERVS
ncbi:MAG: hypothetical protein ACKPGT_32875 [Microcystis sp.]